MILRYQTFNLGSLVHHEDFFAHEKFLAASSIMLSYVSLLS
jgi:hypothetical protein